MIKVLHVTESLTGGILTFLEGLVNGMDDAFSSYILYAKRRPETPATPEKLFRAGTTLIHAEHLVRSIHPKEDLLACLEVRKAVQRIKPDIVHLHSSKAGVIGRWALNGRKIPLFYTPNGYSFLVQGCNVVKRQMFYYMEKISGCRPCKTIACGKGEYEIGRSVSRTITYVNNGINTAELDDLATQHASPSSISVCTLARISQQKNPALFNEIAKRLPDVHFVWIGDGELRHELVSPNIEVTGWLPKRQALEKLMKHSVFLLPSSWEGLPLSILEAMYLNRLCIVSNIPGNVDAIVNGENGFICNNVDEYVHVLQQLVMYGIDEGVIENARKTVLNGFTKEHMALQYTDIYRKACSGRM